MKIIVYLIKIILPRKKYKDYLYRLASWLIVKKDLLENLDKETYIKNIKFILDEMEKLENEL